MATKTFKTMTYEVHITVRGRNAIWEEVDRKWMYDRRYIKLQNTIEPTKEVIVEDLGKLRCTLVADGGWESSEWLDHIEGVKANWYKMGNPDALF